MIMKHTETEGNCKHTGNCKQTYIYWHISRECEFAMAIVLVTIFNVKSVKRKEIRHLCLYSINAKNQSTIPSKFEQNWTIRSRDMNF